MASHAPSDIITTLPSEVLGIIVHHCDDGDLGNLRLSCKTLGTAATQPFGRRCLAERRFVFAEYSMQGLVDLTVHPVFSPCVRSLSFGICRLEMPKYEPASTDASRQKLSELVDKNNDFVHSGTHMLMLVQALQNLKAHGNLQVSLGVFDDYRYDGSLLQGVKEASIGIFSKHSPPFVPIFEIVMCHFEARCFRGNVKAALVPAFSGVYENVHLWVKATTGYGEVFIDDWVLHELG